MSNSDNTVSMTQSKGDAAVKSKTAWSGSGATKALEQIKKAGYKANAPCIICEQPIDYRLPSTDPDGCSVEHIKPRSTHPHLIWEPTNWAPAHLRCNQEQSNRQTYALGTTSKQWG